jgi:anti-sigma factor RsiW
MHGQRAQKRRKLRNDSSIAHTCKAEVTLIADYLTDKLSPTVVAAFEDHLSACRDCAAFLQTYKKTIEITRAFIRHQPQAKQFRMPFLRQQNEGIASAARAASDLLPAASNETKPDG